MPVPAGEQRWAGAATADRLSTLARTALARSAALSGARRMTFDKNDAGAPRPSAGWYWSISHKTTYAGGVVSRSPVGFDIERIRDVHPGLFARTATAAEWDMVQRTNGTLFRFWTAKEAVLKAAGTGIRDLSRCRVVTVSREDEMVLTLHEQRYTVVHKCFDGHIAAVTDADGRAIHWHIDPT